MKTHPYLEIAMQKLRLEPSTWVVTGAAGFIASHLVETLLTLNQKVVGLDNLSTGSIENLKDVEQNVGPKAWQNFTFIRGDIRDLSTCQNAIAGADIVLHHAALGSVPRSIVDPISTHENNQTGFLNVLVAARDEKIKKVVFASSSSVYGDSQDSPKNEDKIGAPLSPYAVSKLGNELYARVFSLNYQMSVIGLRYFNVFGPRQSPAGQYAAVIPRWLQGLSTEQQTEIYGDGSTSRDFCYVKNVVQMNLLAATANLSQGHATIFNTACHRGTTLTQLHTMIASELKCHNPSLKILTPKYEPWRKGDILHSLASIERAKETLNYEPLYSVNDGIRETVNWYQRLNGSANSSKRSIELESL